MLQATRAVVVVAVTALAIPRRQQKMPTYATSLCTKCADRTTISTLNWGESSEALGECHQEEFFERNFPHKSGLPGLIAFCFVFFDRMYFHILDSSVRVVCTMETTHQLLVESDLCGAEGLLPSRRASLPSGQTWGQPGQVSAPRHCI